MRYSYAAELYAVSAGFAWYTYPDSSDDLGSTAEVFGSFGLNVPLNPTLSVFHDFQRYHTQYYELSISHPFEELVDGVSLTPFAGFGFASHPSDVYHSDGFVQSTVGLSLAVPIGEFTLTPVANYTFKADDNAVNEFWFGTTLAYTL